MYIIGRKSQLFLCGRPKLISSVLLNKKLWMSAALVHKDYTHPSSTGAGIPSA